MPGGVAGAQFIRTAPYADSAPGADALLEMKVPGKPQR